MEPKLEVLPPDPSRPRLPPPKPNRGGLWGLLAAVGAVLYKVGLPILVWGKTGGTMLLSMGAYMALGWSWQFAVGFVVLILMHEMGHFVSAKCYHVQVTAPMFIPFFGAYVMLKNRPLNPWVNAVISYCGPLAGGLGGWVAYYLGLALGWRWLFVVAFYTFILNLINLAPISPLDGSHIWITFSSAKTPNMTFSDRIYMGIFLAALIAGLLLGCLHSWRYMHPLY